MIKLDIFQLIIIVFRFFFGLKLVSVTKGQGLLPTIQYFPVPAAQTWSKRARRARRHTVSHGNHWAFQAFQFGRLREIDLPAVRTIDLQGLLTKRGLLVYLTVTAMIRSIRLLFVRFCRYITRYIFKYIQNNTYMFYMLVVSSRVWPWLPSGQR